MSFINKQKPIYKIVMAGYANTGKTALRRRYVDNVFSESANYQATIGLDFSVKTIQQSDSLLKLHIWDHGGCELYHDLCIPLFHQVDACIVSFDLSSRQSFEDIYPFMKRIIKPYTPSCTIILAGNKRDKGRAIEPERVHEYIEEWNRAYPSHRIHQYVESSAKTNRHVTEMFNETIRAITRASDMAFPAEPSEQEFKSRLTAAFEARMAADRARYCGLYRFFVRSRVENRLHTLSVSDFIQHARRADNRSRAVCVELGWLDRNGGLTENTPGLN
ncbi:Rab family GTPase [Legionella sp. CNM-4043-24]|uniref:Rab family GTPase n=1 Tax=Legionella sp. CNM-4043-24 TaxID=3421646 RepID=UPI00403AEC7C